MSAKLSRRALAHYGASQLMAGTSVSKVAQALAASLVDSGRASEAEFLIADINWELERR